MNRNYTASLRKLGLNPKNFEIKIEKPAEMSFLGFLKWAFNPPPHRRGRSKSWDQAYFDRYMYYYSGKLTRAIFK